MPSAVAFLPATMSEFMNFATSLSLNFGSGMMRRLGTSRRRGMVGVLLCYSARPSARLGLRFRPLDAVLRALAVAVGFVGRRRTGGAGRIQGAPDDVVADAGQVFDAAPADQDDGVLLQVVPLAGDVARHFHSVGQPDATDLAEGGVRLLRCRRVNAH